MPHARIVVIGASAGGFEAVRTVLAGLPAVFPASVLIVIHTGPSGLLPSAIGKETALPVGVASDGERLQVGRVYVAAPDRHLTVVDGRVRVTRGPREHGFRPAIDPLFTTAARVAGSHAAGVILSGALSDGTLGLQAIKHGGGLALVQHPEEAVVPSMPLSALRSVAVDAVLPASEIGPQLVEWAMNGARRGAAWGHWVAGGAGRRPRRPAPPQLMAITCPSCGGAISEVEEEGLAHYECHVGHRFDAESLVALTDERTEDTLWQAARALQEQALLRRRMADLAKRRGLDHFATTWRKEADQAEARGQDIRRLIEGVVSAPAARLVEAGDTRQAANGSRRRRDARPRPGGALAATREQARLSKEMHQASRLESRRTKETRATGRPGRVSRRRK